MNFANLKSSNTTLSRYKEGMLALGKKTGADKWPFSIDSHTVHQASHLSDHSRWSAGFIMSSLWDV